MTNEELIHWAHLEGHSDLRDELDALIWIAKMEGKKEVASWLNVSVRQIVDAGLLSSYPGGLLKRRKAKMPTEEDYLAALGPCGK